MSNQDPQRESSPALLSYIRKYRRRLLLGSLLVLCSVLFSVCVPFILRFAIDDLSGGQMTLRRLGGYAGGYVLAAALGGLFSLWMRLVIFRAGYWIESEIRDVLFAHLTRLDRDFFRGERTGDLMTRMNADLAAVRELIGQGFLQGCRTGFGFVLAFTVMFLINARIAAWLLVLLPIISLVFFALLRHIRRRYEACQEQFSNISSFLQECFSGIRTIKGFGLENRQREGFDQLNQEYIRRNMSLSYIERPVWPLMAFLFAIGMLLLLLVGGRQVIHGHLTLGEFVQFVQYLAFLQWPMLALGWTTNLAQRGLTSWGRIQTVLRAQPRIRDGEWTNHRLDKVGGDVVFRNVTLRMDGRTLLDNVSLTLPAGRSVGITGPTGSGKSLLAALMVRLVEPTLGTVEIGGRDIREYPLAVLRRHIGMAPQEPFLFSDTLARNIALGLEENPPDRIAWAADVAQLSPDVELFPRGYETLLGERGITLSGGQRQRAAISRAIARQPELLILDDVFSAIDTQTESRILQRLRDVVSGRTTVLISHRVSTLRECDHLFVFERGRVTQSGTHPELIRQAGYYRELDEIQRLEARLEAG
jgi:ATP-binding cassette subfamily B multidrug efflux pump